MLDVDVVAVSAFVDRSMSERSTVRVDGFVSYSVPEDRSASLEHDIHSRLRQLLFPEKREEADTNSELSE